MALEDATPARDSLSLVVPASSLSLPAVVGAQFISGLSVFSLVPSYNAGAGSPPPPPPLQGTSQCLRLSYAM